MPVGAIEPSRESEGESPVVCIVFIWGADLLNQCELHVDVANNNSKMRNDCLPPSGPI